MTPLSGASKWCLWIVIVAAVLIVAVLFLAAHHPPPGRDLGGQPYVIWAEMPDGQQRRFVVYDDPLWMTTGGGLKFYDDAGIYWVLGPAVPYVIHRGDL